MTGYPLAALLRLRERAEDEAKAALAVARAELAEAERAVAAREEALAAARARRERAEDAVTGSTAGALLAAADHAARLRALEAAEASRLAAAASARAAAAAALREREAALLAARRDRRAIELHRERWLARRDRARATAEDAAMDEVAARAVGRADDQG